MPNPALDARHAERMIKSLSCQAEVMGYWRQAKSRGVAAHELKLLGEAKNRLKKLKKWNDRWRELI